MKNQLERTVYVISITSVILSFFIQSAIINTILLLSSLIYLTLGWYLINPIQSKKFDPIYFILGYSFSTVLIAFVFRIKEYPMEETIMYMGLGLLLLSTIVLLFLKPGKNKLEPLIKTILFLILSVFGVFI